MSPLLGRPNEALQQMGAVGGVHATGWRVHDNPTIFALGGLAPAAELGVRPHHTSLRAMVLLDIAVGAAFGGVGAWGTVAGLYDKLTRPRSRRLRARQLPRWFWRWSLLVALLGAVLGGFAMWRVQSGP